MTLKDKIILITGGTGSFGRAFVTKLIASPVKEIRIFSRDEKKQDDMRKHFNSTKLKFYIGDVRDIESLRDSLSNVDYVFHAAALKQVPSCEFYPMETFKTNVKGTENVINSAIANNVKKVICLSTDKAVYPINTMGISKAMMEKIAHAKSRFSDKTVIAITRYGNVMASRGSVIPLFIDLIKNSKPITLTDSNITRFMMTLDNAIDLVLFAFEHAKSGEIFVQKSPASTIGVLVNALCDLFGEKNYPVSLIGTRHGEKLYESLLSREEMASSVDMGEYFMIPPDMRDLNYDKYYISGEAKISNATDYNSQNTKRLNEEEMKLLLLKVPYVKAALLGDLDNPTE